MATLELQQSVLRDVSALEELPYPIPGLAYTHEERMEAVRQAEEEIAAGKMEEWNKFEKEMMAWSTNREK